MVRCSGSIIDSIVSSLPHNLADYLHEPDTFVSLRNGPIQNFDGLRIWDAQLGFHFSVPAVLAATGLFLPVGGVLLFSHLWERVWKDTVFGSEEPEKEPTVLARRIYFIIIFSPLHFIVIHSHPTLPRPHV